MPAPLAAWPYPFWIAHRGAGKLAPENTLAAMRVGQAHGYRMFECDAKLSGDGVLYLLHDATLDRTTCGRGPAQGKPWAWLAQRDAGRWHSRLYGGEPLPTLATIVQWCIAQHLLLNIEIKPHAGEEVRTGQAVAELVSQCWPAARPAPLLSSFQPKALAAARQVNGKLPLGLLVDAWRDDVLLDAHALGCAALIAHHTVWDQARVLAAHAHSVRCLSYTVNERAQAAYLIGLGIDGIITDRVDLFDPDCR